MAADRHLGHWLPIDISGAEREGARRARIELVGSLAPNTIVLGVDERRVLVHQLRPRAQEREPLARRAR